MNIYIDLKVSKVISLQQQLRIQLNTFCYGTRNESAMTKKSFSSANFHLKRF